MYSYSKTSALLYTYVQHTVELHTVELLTVELHTVELHTVCRVTFCWLCVLCALHNIFVWSQRINMDFGRRQKFQNHLLFV